jgi:hypothetical protein
VIGFWSQPACWRRKKYKMAKRRHDPSPAEDYIEQLNWQADHPNPRGGYRYPLNMPSGRFINLMMLVGIAGVGAYLIFSSGMEKGTKFFIGIMAGLIFLVLFFAGRDNSKDSEK